VASNGFDTRELNRLILQLGRNATNAETEFKRVLGSARLAAATETKRAISARYAIKQGRVAQAIVVRADQVRLSLEIKANGKPISAQHFQGRQTRQGYRFVILKSGAPITIRRGFSHANKVPLMRVGRARYPIQGIFGPSVPAMMENPAVAAPIVERVGTRVIADVTRRIQRILA